MVNNNRRTVASVILELKFDSMKLENALKVMSGNAACSDVAETPGRPAAAKIIQIQKGIVNAEHVPIIDIIIK
jgi:hypothetical protein